MLQFRTHAPAVCLCQSGKAGAIHAPNWDEARKARAFGACEGCSGKKSGVRDETESRIRDAKGREEADSSRGRAIREFGKILTVRNRRK